MSVQEPDDRRCSRLAVALVLLFSAGCEFDEPNGQIIVTVERDSPPVPAAGATAAIGGAPLTLTTNAAGTATFVLVPAGTKQVYASLPGYCAATASVILDDGDTDRVTLTLGSPPCPVDQIATGGGNALYALVDVRTGTSADTTCENDRFVEGHAGVAELGTNARAITWSGPCRSAAWIFSADHAPWFSNRAVDFTWTDSDGDVFNVTLPAARLRVPVTIWISDPLIDAADYRDRVLPIDLDQVNGFLHDSRSGFRLTNSINADAAPDIIDVGSLTDPRTGSPPYPIIGNACENTHAIIASPQVYRSDHINVYAVSALRDGAAGRTCFEYGAANVIFLDKDMDYVTLVHEIGHALGLQRPNSGHVDNVAGTYPENVMMGPPTVAGHLTLGQIVRMHLDQLSWLNTPALPASVRSRQFTAPPLVRTCSCPGNAATDDCPRVDSDIARAGTENTANAPACHMTTVPTCLSLAPNARGTVSAFGWTDSTALVAGAGDQLVASMAPELATVTMAAANVGFVQVDVTAGANAGNTSILISIGGNVVSIPVRIGVACP